jgi:hypothetical protein
MANNLVPDKSGNGGSGLGMLSEPPLLLVL